MNKSALEFAVFCIESVAERLSLPGNQVYDMLTKQSNILYSYVIP